MINFIIWLIAGAAIGFLPTLIKRDRSGLRLNIVLGIVGVFFTGYLVMPMFHLGTINQENLNFPALLISLGITIVFLAIVNSIRFFRNRGVSNDVLQSKWMQIREKINTRWNRLTEEDIDKIDGKHDRFIDILQERYGLAKRQAEEQLQGYLKAVTRKSRSSFLYDHVRNVAAAHDHDRS